MSLLLSYDQISLNSLSNFIDSVFWNNISYINFCHKGEGIKKNWTHESWPLSWAHEGGSVIA